ncbi:MAG: acyl-CoA dehydrogenase [Actinobacteria bacterium]|nr:acyl-CoA dehydrogenase [Actinomycetota bacterium]
MQVDPAPGPDPVLDSPERAALRDTLRRLVDTVSPAERIAALDEAEEFDVDLFAALGAAGVLAIGAPAAAGGAGDGRDQLVVVEELGAGPTSMAAFVIAHYAVTQVLAAYGHTPAHADLVDRLVAGATRCAFALSEPAGGTDVARVMRTRAVPDGDGWRLAGQKLWTSGAREAEAIVVLARTAPIEASPVHGVTMFLVPRDAPGVEVRTIDTFGIRGCSTCEVFLDDVALPADAVLGEVDRGMRQVFATINREGLNATAACLGVGRAALDLVTGYAREREVFGRPIGGFQGPQHGLVDGAVALESARSLMWRAAEVEVAGGDAGVLAAMAKLVASEAAVDLTLKGMQLMGGLGYTRAVAMGRLFRDVRLWSFSPLTNEMVRNRIGEQHLGLPRSY